jgi:hypothetical protein
VKRHQVDRVLDDLHVRVGLDASDHRPFTFALRNHDLAPEPDGSE